ncbi:gag-pol polyprotein precursor [Lasius niger]|uniref:Gag-pol polyprotein n=1 Tax=Lasius niger TaxID=67767 RepID=A0A0J7KHQ6_LASNI|nr:gag-pol polyprotein precursor [Lasius niger]
MLNEEEEECERHFSSSHSRDVTGRYIVRLPLKSNPTVLGDSRAKALGCLNRLCHQLSTQESLSKLYIDFIQEYKNMGHMIEVKNSTNQSNLVHYLPHHGVLRENSRTTKLRVVFNGSSRTSNGLSLNDILHPGAKLQTDICDILLWTRTHKVLFSTDIVKMFIQITVHSDDWDLQRILWYGKDKQLLDYHLTTVTYGLNCAPFLALRTLQQLVNDEGHRYPKAVIPMTRGRYVDDIFGGADSTSEAEEIIKELIQLCKTGGFPLQKWSSNHPEILPTPIEDRNMEIIIEPALCKILGLVWRPTTDTLHFVSTISGTIIFTKRAIASDIAKLYDPLGLISPILIRAKIILQELWLIKIGWDESLPVELQNRWSSFRQQLSQLETLSIPRWLGVVHSDTTKIEIHGFSDASQLAMAAAVYIKISKEDNSSTVHLICSKTRVAPLKRLTIPRLELTAALLLARLISKTIKALELTLAPVCCWSDSSVTLTWITAHPSRWKDFVRNRVSAIQEVLPNGTWRYVPGKENPADLASRGLKPDQLIHQNL